MKRLLGGSKKALHATEMVIREEWPVTLNQNPQYPETGRPVKIHPLFGYGWSVRCPHCGGQCKIFNEGHCTLLRAWCWSCGSTGTPVLPVREDWYG